MAVVRYAIDSESGATPEESFLTLQRVRDELRVPVGDTGLDALLSEHAASAVSAVSLDIGLPILEESVYVPWTHSDTEAPVVYDADSFALSLSEIRYRPAESEVVTPGYWPEIVSSDDYSVLAPASDESVISGRIVVTPASAWPEAQSGVYGLYYSRGLLDGDRRLGTLRQLAVLRLRDLYDGVRVVPVGLQSAYRRLARTIEVYTPLPLGFTRLS